MPFLTFPIRGQTLAMKVETGDHLAHVDSAFQAVDVYDTSAFGRVLLLDGHIQLSERDEQAYHECLVRVPLLNCPRTRRALVVGGGDGGAIRELCRLPELHHIDMVEIDQAVVDASRAHLPNVSNGAFEDPRVTLHVEDAFPFVKRVTEPYDLIILDSTDTYEGEEGELSEALFSEEFYRDCGRILSPDGYCVTQADNPVFCAYSVDAIRARLSSVFPTVGSYVGLVPSFGGYSGYCYGTFGNAMAKAWNDTWQASVYLTRETYNLAFCEFAFSR